VNLRPILDAVECFAPSRGPSHGFFPPASGQASCANRRRSAPFMRPAPRPGRNRTLLGKSCRQPDAAEWLRRLAPRHLTKNRDSRGPFGRNCRAGLAIVWSFAALLAIAGRPSRRRRCTPEPPFTPNTGASEQIVRRAKFPSARPSPRASYAPASERAVSFRSRARPLWGCAQASPAIAPELNACADGAGRRLGSEVRRPECNHCAAPLWPDARDLAIAGTLHVDGAPANETETRPAPVQSDPRPSRNSSIGTFAAPIGRCGTAHLRNERDSPGATAKIARMGFWRNQIAAIVAMFAPPRTANRAGQRVEKRPSLRGSARNARRNVTPGRRIVMRGPAIFEVSSGYRSGPPARIVETRRTSPYH